MSVYDVNGEVFYTPRNKSGALLPVAYDISGGKVFPDVTTIKVMSYNVGGWYTGSGTNVPANKKDVYYALQTGMITGNDPDILVIQEYLADFSSDGTSALTMLQGLFPYVHTKTSGTYYGRAVCSKYPITDYVERYYAREPSRYFDSCTITVNGIRLPVVVTHLGLTQENRDVEIVQLTTYLDTLDTFIACGDYNTGIFPSSANTSSSDYIANVKPFVDAGFKTANFGSFGFMQTCLAATGSKLYLDNIYTSSNIEITSAYVDTAKLTDGLSDTVDHMPFIATIQIGGTS